VNHDVRMMEVEYWTSKYVLHPGRRRPIYNSMLAGGKVVRIKRRMKLINLGHRLNVPWQQIMCPADLSVIR
jgi:hypothetical protein